MITIEIESTDRSGDIEQQSVVLSMRLSKEPAILSFEIAGEKTQPSLGNEVVLKENGVPFFKGAITEKRQELIGQLIKNFHYVCKDDRHTLDRQLVAKSYENTDAVSVVSDILSTFTTGFTLEAPATSPTVRSIKFNYEQPSKAIEKIANVIGWDWYVTADNKVKFFPPATEPAPFGITDDNGNLEFKSLTFERNLNELRNVVIIRGGEYETAIAEADAVDKYVADGEQNSLKLIYRYDDVEVTINGVAQTVGVDYIDSLIGDILSSGTTTGTTANKLVDSGATFQTDGVQAGDQVYNSTDETYAKVTAVDSETQLSLNKDIMTTGELYSVNQVLNECLYNFQEQGVRFPEGSLASGDVVRVFGDAKVPLILEAQDEESVMTYGRYEGIEINKSINSLEEAETAAYALLDQWKYGASEGKFKTRETGLRVGQTININSTTFGINDNYKINKVVGKMNGKDELIYEIEFIKSGNVTLTDIMVRLLEREKDNIEISPDEVIQKLRNLEEDFSFSDEMTEQGSTTGPYSWSPVTTGTAFDWNFGTWT